MDLGSFPWNFQRKPIATPRQNRCFLAAPLSGTCQQWWQAWGCHEHFRFLWRSLKLQFSSETLFWYVLRVFSSEFFPVFQVPCPVLMRRRSRRRRKLRHSSKRSRRSRRRRKRNRCKRSKHSSRRKPPRRCHTQHGLATAVLDYFDIISFGLPHQYLAVLYIDHNCLLFVTMIPLQSISITCITISLFILIMGDGWLGDSCNTVYPIYIPIKSHQIPLVPIPRQLSPLSQLPLHRQDLASSGVNHQMDWSHKKIQTLSGAWEGAKKWWVFTFPIETGGKELLRLPNHMIVDVS